MKAQDFQALFEQLGDLRQVQREALVEALTATGSGGEVVALIETRFAAAPTCGHCGATDFKPWGSPIQKLNTNGGDYAGSFASD